MDSALRESVRLRAQHRCEYCRLSQVYSELRFHIEHIIPRVHGGRNETGNLALACPACNFHKGPNLTGIEPDTSTVVRLFHPRRDVWEDHFRSDGIQITSITSIGRTSVWLLQMNDAGRLRIRAQIHP